MIIIDCARITQQHNQKNIIQILEHVGPDGHNFIVGQKDFFQIGIPREYSFFQDTDLIILQPQGFQLNQWREQTRLNTSHSIVFQKQKFQFILIPKCGRRYAFN